MISREEKTRKIIEAVKKFKEISLSDLWRETKIGYYALKFDLVPSLVNDGTLEYSSKGNSYVYVKLKKK